MITKIINRFTCNEKQLYTIIKNLNKKNMYPILDYINEYNKDHYKNYNKIMDSIEKFPNNFFSIKMSSLNIHNNYSLSEKYITNICENAITNNCKILIDAENYIIQDSINNITDELVSKYNKQNTNIYKTYQCYRKDSYELIQKDLLNKADYNLGIKLVRGAYYNQDFKYNILYDELHKTHENYNNCMNILFKECSKNDDIILATHNYTSCKIALNNKHLLKNNELLSFAQLMGMADPLSKSLSKSEKVYKYVPFGNFHESIPYLLRRLYENKYAVKHIFK